MALSKKSKGLGRGLDALFGESKLDSWMSDDQGLEIEEISTECIIPGQYQPRVSVSDSNLNELADSIAKHGVMSPILVRPIGGAKYEIIAGERRFQAAKIAGLGTVPVVVRKLDDKTALSFAIIENIQREDLNAIEVALSIDRLIKEFGYTQDEAASVIGKSRSDVSNHLRLLNLSEDIRRMVSDGKISAGHARAVLGIPEEGRMAVVERIIEQSLNVRQTEDLVKRLQMGPEKKPLKSEVVLGSDSKPVYLELEKKLNAKVEVRGGMKGRGSIVIKYSTQEELERIVDLIKG